MFWEDNNYETFRMLMNIRIDRCASLKQAFGSLTNRKYSSVYQNLFNKYGSNVHTIPLSVILTEVKNALHR